MSIRQMSRKLFITLILILFLLPFLSWYYLQQGLNWRKKAQLIMNGTELFPSGDWVDLSGKKLSSAQLENHVTLITRISCKELNDMSKILNEFYDQFKETNKANVVILDSCQVNSSFLDQGKANWYVFSCFDSVSLCQSLQARWPQGKSNALVDKNMIIRSYYASATEDEKRILLEHMALLLPRDRSEKIELKRGHQE